MPKVRNTAVMTAIALVAFAGNSILNRMALVDGSIDATSFTIIRLVAGAITLWLLVAMNTHSLKLGGTSANILPATLLFVYAATFSYAYVMLGAAIGALVLFGFVQLTMLAYGFLSGVRFSLLQWLGMLLATSGLFILIFPATDTYAHSVSFIGFLLMALSGIAWGGYTLLGKKSHNPLRDTTLNFIYTLPLSLLLSLIYFGFPMSLSANGIIIAVVAGSLTTGAGYAIWYRALSGLSPVQASVLQLLVPIIAAIGGIIFLAEDVTIVLLVSMSMTLGGISLVLIPSSKK